MTAASNSEARKRQADPTPHTDPTAAAVRAAQAEALCDPEVIAADYGHWAASGFGDADRADVTHFVCECGLPWTVGEGCPFVQGVRAQRPAAPVAVEGVETVEWGWQGAEGGAVLAVATKRDAEKALDVWPSGVVVSRRVSEWSPVEPGGGESRG